MNYLMNYHKKEEFYFKCHLVTIFQITMIRVHLPLLVKETIARWRLQYFYKVISN